MGTRQGTLSPSDAKGCQAVLTAMWGGHRKTPNALDLASAFGTRRGVRPLLETGLALPG